MSNPVFVEDERRRNALDGQRIIEAVHREQQRLLFQKAELRLVKKLLLHDCRGASNFLAARIHVDETDSRKFFLQAAEGIRQFRKTRPAPERKEIEDDDFVFVR